MHHQSSHNPRYHSLQRDHRGDVEVEEQEEGHRRREHRVEAEAVDVVVERVLPQPCALNTRVRVRPADVEPVRVLQLRLRAAALLDPLLVGDHSIVVVADFALASALVDEPRRHIPAQSEADEGEFEVARRRSFAFQIDAENSLVVVVGRNYVPELR